MADTALFSRLATAAALAIALAVAPAALQAAPEDPTSIRIDLASAPAGASITVALNGGKIGEVPVAPGGGGSSVFNDLNLGKVRVDVYIKVCKDGRTQVLLYTDGGTPPANQDCEDRKIGAFWWHKARRITINVSNFTLSAPGGLLSGRNIAIGSGILAGGVGLATLGGGNGSPAPNTPAGGGGGTNNPGGGGGTPTFSFLNRVFRNTITSQQDNCGGFAPSGSTTLTVNVDTGTGAGPAVHAHSSATLNYNATSTRSGDTAGTLNGTGTVSFGAQVFSLVLTVTVNGGSISGTERFTRTAGGGSCVVLYNLTGNAQ